MPWRRSIQAVAGPCRVATPMPWYWLCATCRLSGRPRAGPTACHSRSRSSGYQVASPAARSKSSSVPTTSKDRTLKCCNGMALSGREGTQPMPGPAALGAEVAVGGGCPAGRLGGQLTGHQIARPTDGGRPISDFQNTEVAAVKQPFIDKNFAHLGLEPQPPSKGRAREVVHDFAAGTAGGRLIALACPPTSPSAWGGVPCQRDASEMRVRPYVEPPGERPYIVSASATSWPPSVSRASTTGRMSTSALCAELLRWRCGGQRRGIHAQSREPQAKTPMAAVSSVACALALVVEYTFDRVAAVQRNGFGRDDRALYRALPCRLLPV